MALDLLYLRARPRAHKPQRRVAPPRRAPGRASLRRHLVGTPAAWTSRSPALLPCDPSFPLLPPLLLHLAHFFPVKSRMEPAAAAYGARPSAPAPNAPHRREWTPLARICPFRLEFVLLHRWRPSPASAASSAMASASSASLTCASPRCLLARASSSAWTCRATTAAPASCPSPSIDQVRSIPCPIVSTAKAAPVRVPKAVGA